MRKPYGTEIHLGCKTISSFHHGGAERFGLITITSRTRFPVMEAEIRVTVGSVCRSEVCFDDTAGDPDIEVGR
jgi:hypothetical protein